MSEAYGARKDTQSEQDEHVNIEGVGAKKVLTMGRTSGNALVDTLIDADGHLQVDMVSGTLSTGDIQIGAVEIKDATTDNRAVVDSSGNVQVEITNPSIAGTAGSPNANVISVQGITSGTTLPVTAAVASSIGGSSKTVTTAGTQVALAASTSCSRVIITALVTNTGVIWVGGSDVAAGVGKPLVPLQDIEIRVDNLADIWIDSTVNGEGVSFLYEVP